MYMVQACQGVVSGGVCPRGCSHCTVFVIVKHAGTSYRDSLDRPLYKGWNGHHELETYCSIGVNCLITVITVTVLHLLLLLLLYIQ